MFSEIDVASVLLLESLPPDGHTTLVTCYDPEKRRLALVDPNIPAAGISTVTYDEFQQLRHVVIKDERQSD